MRQRIIIELEDMDTAGAMTTTIPLIIATRDEMGDMKARLSPHLKGRLDRQKVARAGMYAALEAMAE